MTLGPYDFLFTQRVPYDPRATQCQGRVSIEGSLGHLGHPMALGP